MSVYADLLFMHGHIANVELARQLAGEEPVPSVAEAAAGVGKVRLDQRGHEQAGTPTRHIPQLPGTCSNR